MKKLGIGIQELSKFKEQNLIYVDKTKIVHRLVTSGEYYFLSRPRRFGKSLLVNTMKELFLGNREVFEGTWIYDNWEWEESNPVVHIDFTSMDYKNLGLDVALGKELDRIAHLQGIEYTTSHTYAEKFSALIEKLGVENRVAILIDEYDKPIIDFLDKTQRSKAEENRQILKTLYSCLKNRDKYIRILFITGVSKFSRVSIFSELNNLLDITTDKNYSTLTGYTKEEIEANYSDYIERVRADYNMDRQPFLDAVKMWYNGYSWDAENFVFNPFSIISMFATRALDNYWFKSGTPTFLTKLIRERNIDISEYDSSFEVSANALDSYEIEKIDLKVLLFQTGYLTIKERKINPMNYSSIYRLAYPNMEVRDSFYNHLISEYTGIEKTSFYTITEKLKQALEINDIESFMLNLKSLYASIPYDIFIEEREAYYHSVIYLVLRLLSAHTDVEVETNRGRIDAVVQTENYIHVMEFKMGNAEEAIAQIEEKKYYEKYLSDGREIILLGVAFGAEEKNVKDVIEKKIEEAGK
jgi:hypothetical protein